MIYSLVELTFQEKKTRYFKISYGKIARQSAMYHFVSFSLYVAQSNRKVISKSQIRRDRKKSINTKWFRYDKIHALHIDSASFIHLSI